MNIDWTDRALEILQSEGFSLARLDVAHLLQNFDGDARDLIDLLEEYILAAQTSQMLGAHS